MSWQMIPLEEVAPSPWRNGGGVTRELIAWPTPQDWDWRISVAEIEKDGPFSRFEGVERWFAVLGGAGVRLTLDGQHARADGARRAAAFRRRARLRLRADRRAHRGLQPDAQARARARAPAACAGRAAMSRSSPARVWRCTPGTSRCACRCDRKFVTVPPHTLAWRALADGASVHIEAPTALWMEMAPMTLQLWTHCDVATLQAGHAAPYGLVEDAALAVEGGKIAWVGPRSELPAELARALHARTRRAAAR